MATFYKAPTSNYWSTTLNGAINDSVDTITLTTTSGLQAPGVLVINREDGSGTATPSAREVIHYTGISSNDLTGCTRGEEGSTARSHSDGALVEAVFTVEHWNDLRDAVAVITSTDGTNLAISGTASIATLRPVTTVGTVMAVTSIASIARVETPYLKATDGDAVLDSLSVTSTASAYIGDFSNVRGVDLAMTGTASIGIITHNAAKPFLKTDSDGATVTFDMNAANVHQVTLGGNRTLAVTNVSVGQAFVVRLIQDATGSRTVTWWTDINWDNNTAPTLSTTGTRTDVFGFLCSSANNYDGFILGQDIRT